MNGTADQVTAAWVRPVKKRAIAASNGSIVRKRTKASERRNETKRTFITPNLCTGWIQIRITAHGSKAKLGVMTTITRLCEL